MEERLQRCDDGLVIALINPFAIRLRRGGRKADFENPAGKAPRYVEARAGEYVEHGTVLRKDFRDERLDPALGAEVGELLEQTCANAMALIAVVDREGDLCAPLVAEPRPARYRHDSLGTLVFDDADERAPVGPIGIEERSDERVSHSRMAVEAEVEASPRKVLEECEYGFSVVGGRRAQAKRPALAQDDVANERFRRQGR
jgi:hypothetical protein